MTRTVRRGIPGLLAVALVLLIGAQIQAQEAVPEDYHDDSGLAVERIAICTAVENREPVAEATTFPIDAGQLYCFTKITGAPEETQVTHVWYYGEEEKARVTLRVASAAWRTWSSKRFWHTWTGDWKVVVEDANGNVIGETGFTLTAGPADAGE